MSVKRNCHTCGWDGVEDGRYSVCLSPDYAADDERYTNLAEWIDGNVTGPGSMPPHDADGCPGWKPKPGAEDVDRAQLAILGTDPLPAVEAPNISEAVVALEEMQAQTIRATGNVGWRGHEPICRGPGGTVARRLRRLVRGRR